MLKQRVVTALAMLFALLAVVFWAPRTGWLAFTALVVAVAAFEWAGLIGLAGRMRIGYGIVTVVLLLLGILIAGLAGAQADAPPTALLVMLGLGTAFWLAVAPLWLSGKWPLRAAGVGAAVGWIVVLPAGLALVVLRDIDPWLLLAAMAVVWVADIAAYFVGRAIGKRKLAPAISPGKSWEGALGAVVSVVAYGFIVARLWPGLGIPGGSGAMALFALVLVLLTAVSIVGDLFESMMKRQAGMKDSSQLLPGHGGVLDRIDALLPVLPLALTVTLWLA